MNVVILGSGRTGNALATSLASGGHSITVIDRDASNAATLLSGRDGNQQVEIVEGDGMSNFTLERAGIRDADLFAALTGEDTTNGLAALKAKVIYRTMTVIAAVWSGDLSSVYESMGIACVNPGRLSADSVLANIPQVLQDQASESVGE